MLRVALAGLLEEARVVLVQLLAHDRVGVLQDLELLGAHRADDANRQAGARERLTVHDVLGQAQRQAQFAHLVLEKVVERLDEIEVHALGERDKVCLLYTSRCV